MGFEPSPSYLHSSLPELLEELKRAGIDRAVIPGNCIAKPECAGVLKGLPAEKGQTLEMVPNEEIAELVRLYPDTFVGVGAVDPMEENVLDETERVIKELGVRGIAIGPGQGMIAMYPDDKRLTPIYDLCDQLNTPVFVKLSHQVGPDSSYGNPLYLGHVASDFPNLKIVVVHGAWPCVREVVALAHRYRNIYIQPDFYTIFPGSIDYVDAANTILQDRFIYASGYPVYPVEEMLQRFVHMPFHPKVFPKVLYENAAELLRI